MTPVAPGRPSLTTALKRWKDTAFLLPKITANELKVVDKLCIFAKWPESRAHYYATGELKGYPSQDTLAELTDLFRQAVNAAVKRLEKRGVLRVTKRGGGGRNKRNEYLYTEPENAVSKTQQPRCVSSSDKNATPKIVKRNPAGELNATTPFHDVSLKRNNIKATSASVARSALAVGTATLAPEKKKSSQSKIKDGLALMAFLLENDAVSKLCLKAENYFDASVLKQVSTRATSLLGEDGSRVATILLLLRRARQALNFLTRLKDEAAKEERLTFVGDDLLEAFQHRNGDRMPTTSDFLAFLREQLETVKQRRREREKDEERHWEEE